MSSLIDVNKNYATLCISVDWIDIIIYNKMSSYTWICVLFLSWWNTTLKFVKVPVMVADGVKSSLMVREVLVQLLTGTDFNIIKGPRFESSLSLYKLCVIIVTLGKVLYSLCTLSFQRLKWVPGTWDKLAMSARGQLVKFVQGIYFASETINPYLYLWCVCGVMI